MKIIFILVFMLQFLLFKTNVSFSQNINFVNWKLPKDSYQVNIGGCEEIKNFLGTNKSVFYNRSTSIYLDDDTNYKKMKEFIAKYNHRDIIRIVNEFEETDAIDSNDANLLLRRQNLPFKLFEYAFCIREKDNLIRIVFFKNEKICDTVLNTNKEIKSLLFENVKIFKQNETNCFINAIRYSQFAFLINGYSSIAYIDHGQDFQYLKDTSKIDTSIYKSEFELLLHKFFTQLNRAGVFTKVYLVE